MSNYVHQAPAKQTAHLSPVGHLNHLHTWSRRLAGPASWRRTASTELDEPCARKATAPITIRGFSDPLGKAGPIASTTSSPSFHSDHPFSLQPMLVLHKDASASDPESTQLATPVFPGLLDVTRFNLTTHTLHSRVMGAAASSLYPLD